MSHADHEWTKDLIAAHVAGGLGADERARLEAHAAECGECRAALDGMREFDRSMGELFASVRPKAGLEERVIHSLRAEKHSRVFTYAIRTSLGLAAAGLFGVLGYLFEDGAFMVTESAREIDMSASQHKSHNQENRRAQSWGDSATKLSKSDNDIAGDPDHNETSDDEFAKLKGDSLDFAADKPFQRMRLPGSERTALSFDRDRGRYAQLGSTVDQLKNHLKIETGGKELRADGSMMGGRNEEGKRAPADPEKQNKDYQGYYSYRDNSPAARPSSGESFKPGESALALLEKKMVETERNLAAPGSDVGPGLVTREAAGNEAYDLKAQSFHSSLPVKTPVTSLQDPKPGSGQQAPPPSPRQIIIRSGEMEFEVDSFDSCAARIGEIVAEEQGFIATINSEKLPNGKVRGVVVVRVDPNHLGSLLQKLRALGELKSQRIGSEDVTKHYTDLESRLRAARTMEERLIQIIKTGQGSIKELLQVEKELGEWRTKIETLEGEIRYYNNLASLATLTITMYEKEIRAAHGITETERIEMGIEVEDVDKTYKDALAAIADKKGRVTKSDLKQQAAGQFHAVIHFEVDPKEAGELRDRLKQFGTVARLDIQRQQSAEGGATPQRDAAVKRNDTQFFVSIYTLANVDPRETVLLNLACPDAEAVYKAILARVEKAGGRVVTSSLNHQKNDQTQGAIHFQVKSAEAEAVLSDARVLGEVMRFTVVENPDAQTVTKSKRGFQVQIFALGCVAPRETTSVNLVSKDVPESYRSILEAAKKSGVRLFNANLNEQDRQNVSANLDFEVLREHLPALEESMKAAGSVYSRTSNRAQDSETTVESKTRITLTLMNAASIPPREIRQIAVEVGEVERALASVQAAAVEVQGRVVASDINRNNGQIVARVVIDVPLSSLPGVAGKVTALGAVRSDSASKSAQVPDSPLAVARIFVDFTSGEPLVAKDSGFLEQIKKGISGSLTAAAFSLRYILMGLCVVVPWGLILYGGWKLARRMKKKPA